MVELCPGWQLVCLIFVLKPVFRSPCTTDEDCDKSYQCLVCPDYDVPGCFHGIIFFTQTPMDAINTILLSAIIFSAAFAGIGGGGLNVPLLSSDFLFSFQLTDAKILSHVITMHIDLN